MANRPGRIKALIEKDVMEIVRGLNDPKIGFCSVNEVEVNDDYSVAKAYVSFFGNPHPHQAFEELQKKEGAVRTRLASMLDLYKVPKVVFVYDDSFERAARLDDALKQEEKDLEAMKKSSDTQEDSQEKK